MLALCAASDARWFVKPSMAYRYIIGSGFSIDMDQTVFYSAFGTQFIIF